MVELFVSNYIRVQKKDKYDVITLKNCAQVIEHTEGTAGIHYHADPNFLMRRFIEEMLILIEICIKVNP